MPEEIDALVTFYESWKQAGIGSDGLPLYEEVIMIRKAKPPLLSVEGVATEEDREYFRDAWLVFSRQRAARDTTIKGYPLVLWPVITPSDLKTLAAREIITVEQLAGLADRRDVPPEFRELALRAKKLIALQGKTGKFEEIIHNLTIERDTLAEQMKEANATISVQNGMIMALKQKEVA